MASVKSAGQRTRPQPEAVLPGGNRGREITGDAAPERGKGDGDGQLRRPKLDTPALVFELAQDLIPDDGREHFVALYLDAQNRLVATHEVSVGTLSASLVSPREVFGPALRLLGVASVVVAHNHPSGDVTPSREDLRLTRQLSEAANLLDLKLHDHVIVGSGSGLHVSLAERGAF